MNKKLHIMVGMALASLLSAYQTHPKNSQPGFDPVILHELRVVTAGGFVEAYHVLAPLVRSSIGMAVREGASIPDISTPELFVETLLKAESIGYSASASGTYLSTVLLPSLGLWEQLESKSKRILNERVAAVVARGEVEIGFQQISEILPIEGVAYAGPIPSKYQMVTTFSMGITTRTKNISDARSLVDYPSSAEVAAIIVETGLEPVMTET